ncbi:MAG: CRTAC1 family protein [Haloarculaceae archaeon]
MDRNGLDRRTFLALASTLAAGCSSVVPSETTSTPADSGGSEMDIECSGGTVETGIRFTDVAAKDDSAFTYRRGRDEKAVEQLSTLKEKGTVELKELEAVGQTSTYHDFGTHGGYGIVVFDYDNDGDLDVFVPNAQGEPHHLYRNKLAETGEFAFEEVAEEAGVAAPEQDGFGAAAADIDNDGNRELFVTSPPDSLHRVFDNNGDGTFTDVSEQVGITSNGGHLPSFGDIDNDGKVDLFLGTSRTDEHTGKPYLPYKGYALNRLFRNEGDLQFTEVSEESGVQDMDGLDEERGGTRTFGVAMVDIDMDGEMEIMHGDDQMIPAPEDAVPGEQGLNWGMVHVFDNDGDGNFTDMNEEYNLREYSTMSNMGFAFGDFNYDGRLDFLTTAFGDYFVSAMPQTTEFQANADTTKWFLQRPDGSFEWPGLGRLVATPFGWGAAALDYDNDGLTDLVYHGGGDFFANKQAIGTNPGVLLKGLGHGMFAFDETAATSSERDHCRRMTYAVAVGDLNKNGYPDVLSGSNQDVAEGSELEPIDQEYGGPLDKYAKTNVVFSLNEDGETAEYNDFDFADGSLSVEVNSGDNENGWVAVEPAGGVGVAEEAGVNRDGIGATISCTPSGTDRTQRFSVTAGASFGSCHSLEKTFGLGDSDTATVEVLWPGGHRNRLYDVRSEERIVFPEIPYSYDADVEKSAYEDGVESALQSYADAGVVREEDIDRFLDSAVRAYEEA